MEHAGGAGDLRRYFDANTDRQIMKWDHYFDIYERHFSAYRGREISMLEIGVAHGGSLQMWHHYFGPQARIVGLDIDERCREFVDTGVTIEIGSQADRPFLARVAREHGPFDIVLDDEVWRSRGGWSCNADHDEVHPIWRAWGGGRGSKSGWVSDPAAATIRFRSLDGRVEADTVESGVAILIYDADFGRGSTVEVLDGDGNVLHTAPL